MDNKPKFCIKCGSTLNPETGRCPNCDKPAVKVAPTVESTPATPAAAQRPAAKKRDGRNAVIAVLAILLVLAFLATGFLSALLILRGGAEEEKEMPVETEETVTAEEEKTVETVEEIIEENFWKSLPEKYYFSSGAGAWGTELNVNDDGTFTGAFHDSNMGETGDGYPNGTVYYCNFSGKFSAPVQIDETIYSVTLESLQAEDQEGTEHIEDETLFVASEPYGMDGGKEFYIYLPGTPIHKVDPEFMSWSQLYDDTLQTLPENYYGLYNVRAQTGFVHDSYSY